jgi:hypothetical protein
MLVKSDVRSFHMSAKTIILFEDTLRRKKTAFQNSIELDTIIYHTNNLNQNGSNQIIAFFYPSFWHLITNFFLSALFLQSPH